MKNRRRKKTMVLHRICCGWGKTPLPSTLYVKVMLLLLSLIQTRHFRRRSLRRPLSPIHCRSQLPSTLRTMYPNEESPPTFLALPKLFLNVKYVPTIFPTAFCHLSLVRVQRIMENTIWLELLFCLLLRFRGGMSVLRTCSLVYSSTSPR